MPSSVVPDSGKEWGRATHLHSPASPPFLCGVEVRRKGHVEPFLISTRLCRVLQYGGPAYLLRLLDPSVRDTAT
jgi:hypothetical protein